MSMLRQRARLSPGTWVWRSTRTTGVLTRWLELHPLASVFLIVAYVFAVHGPALHGALLEADALGVISLFAEKGPLAPFAQTVPAWPMLYRPLYGVQGWLLYNLFGLNYAGYHIVLVLQFILLTVILYKTLRLAAVNNWIALLASLAVFVHPFSYVNTRWIIDPATLSAIALVAVTALLVRARGGWRWHLVFTALLVAAPVLRESGLTANGMVAVYAVFAFFRGLISRKLAAIMFAEASLTAGLYLALHSTLTSGAEQHIKSAGEHVFSVASYLAKTFFPALRPDPMFTAAQPLVWLDLDEAANFAAWLILSGLLVALGYIALWWQSWLPQRRRTIALVFGVAGLAGAVTVIWLRTHFEFSLRHDVVTGIHGVLSLAILYAVWFLPAWTSRQRTLAVAASGMILANSVVHFPYFVVRSLYFGVVGWALLLALGAQRFPTRLAWQRSVRGLMVVLLVVMALVNLLNPQQDLPAFVAGQFSRSLCPPNIPFDMATRVALHNEIDLGEVYACRLGSRIIVSVHDLADWFASVRAKTPVP